MTWMQTASGIAFDLLAPQPDQVSLDDIAHHLSALCRYTGATSIEARLVDPVVGTAGPCCPRRVPCHYSVAQHSWLVAEWLSDHGRPDLGFAGLMHDAEEAYTGDRSAPMKEACKTFIHPLQPDPFRTIAHRIRAVIWAKFGLAPLSAEDAYAVKHADNVLRQTEKRDLLAAGGRPWPEGPAPWSRRIEQGFSPWAAKETFLSKFERFARLAPGRCGAW